MDGKLAWHQYLFSEQGNVPVLDPFSGVRPTIWAATLFTLRTDANVNEGTGDPGSRSRDLARCLRQPHGRIVTDAETDG